MVLATHRRALASLLTVGLAVSGMPARAADVFVGTPPFNPTPGQAFSIELLVDVGASTLGSYSLEFVYDPSVVNVASIGGGSTPAFNAPPITDPGSFASGLTAIAGVQGGATAPGGFVSIATLNLEAVGTPGQSSVLDLDDVFLFSGTGASLPATVFASSVLIGVPSVPALPGLGWFALTAMLLATGTRSARNGPLVHR
jgi:hypothetical protein